MDLPDLYVILGVNLGATVEEIDAAYRRRVQVIHPDRIDRERSPRAWAEANEMLTELNAAYRVLSDRGLRGKYDALYQQRDAPSPEARQHPIHPTPTEPPTSTKRPWAALLVIGGIILAVVAIDEVSRRTDDDFFRQGNGATRTDPLPEPATQLVGCEDPALTAPMPANGQVWRWTTTAEVAPLEVRTKGSDFYLVKLESDGSPVRMMLVLPGSTTEMLVPLGTYVLKYATGSGQYWCGPSARFPFGRETAFFRTESQMTFRDEGSQYTGYTVELFAQPGGNLATSALSPSVW
jgi:hypothetical protein